ncbi:MAG: antibiotic biosynthesis monooxygenase family protein [Acidimicrobiia bacterium]
MALEPTPGSIVTVFRSRLRADADRAGYHEWAARMLDAAREMPGFVDFKTFVAEDGERLSLVTFSDWPTHEAWASDPRHQEAQRQGRDRFYADYLITVGEVSRAYAFVAA